MMATMTASPAAGDALTALYVVATSFFVASWLGVQSGRRKACAMEATA